MVATNRSAGGCAANQFGERHRQPLGHLPQRKGNAGRKASAVGNLQVGAANVEGQQGRSDRRLASGFMVSKVKLQRPAFEPGQPR